MLFHRFSEIKYQNKDMGLNPFRKCLDCGTVKFEDGEDPFFNMVCNARYQERENLRRKLQGQPRRIKLAKEKLGD